MLEVAHDDRAEGLPLDRGGAARRARQAAPAVGRGHGADRHAVRVQGPRRDHRRLPARQPHHHRRAPGDGQVRPGDATSRRTRRSNTASPSRCSASRCPRRSSHSASSPARPASRARSCARGASRSSAGRRSSRPRTGLADAPLCVDDSSRRRDAGDPREGAAPAPAARRARPDHRRLPAADAPRPADREPRAAGRRDEPRAEDPRARARRAGHRALAAHPCGGERAPTSARCSPTCASPARSSRTPTSSMFIYRDEYYDKDSERQGRPT